MIHVENSLNMRFKQIFKIAKITCVYKGRGSKKEKSSYRLVSNLSLIGKCIEIAVEMQLGEYCEKYNVLAYINTVFERREVRLRLY